MAAHAPHDLGRRVLVAGSSSSGKTTLASQLAERLGLTFVELDAIFWLPGWTEPDAETFRDRVRAALAAAPGGWVVAGDYRSRTHDLTWSAADTIIWLDLPYRLTTVRILRRSWRRWRSREVLWGTNSERFWPQLKLWSPKDSLIAFAWRHRREFREAMTAAMARDTRAGSPAWVRLRSPGEVRAFLDSVPGEAAPRGER